MNLKRILRILLPALLLVLVLLGFFRVRAMLLSHVYAPDAHTGSASGNSPDVSSDSADSIYHLEATNDAGSIGGGQTEDGFVIPVYNGEEIVPINNNVPGFADEESGTAEFYEFSELDELGRPGPAMGCIGPSMLATEERGPIGMIRPAGWHTVKYEFIDGLYLYNRCHLIAYSLCGVNADERNLITGTRYLNVEGMLGIENSVYWYVKDTGNHVYYRVTPRYIGDDLLATGVQMEAYSVEDHGKALSLNMFCFNVQPGVLIDYKTGDNSLDPKYESARSIAPDSGEGASDSDTSAPDSEDAAPKIQSGESDATYILNTNTMRFHLPDCQSVQDMKEKNRKEYFGTREELLKDGYSPCGRCQP